jgi:fructose-1,6-bisphosphatase I
MVSDIHRLMIQGGIFLYPHTRKYPKGKLRLLYECNPMAMIVEQAGGVAITCDLQRILDLPVNDLHSTSYDFNRQSEDGDGDEGFCGEV